MVVSTRGGWGKGQRVAWLTCLFRFGTYNIRNGQNGGLKSALRGMPQANMDLGEFQESKLTKRIYTRESSGYKVVATEATSAYSGSIAIFYRMVENLSVEAFQAHRENIISFQLVSGYRLHYARLRM